MPAAVAVETRCCVKAHTPEVAMFDQWTSMGDVAHDNKRKETTMQTKLKTLIAIALTAATVATASLAVTGEAFAHGKGGRHFFVSRVVVVPTTVRSSCYWKWINFKKVWVCY
jgi:hypothetical protein